MNETTQPAVAGPVEPTVRPLRPHWTVRNCIWGGMAWTVSLTTPTKLELGSRLYSRAEVARIADAMTPPRPADRVVLKSLSLLASKSRPRCWLKRMGVGR